MTISSPYHDFTDDESLVLTSIMEAMNFPKFPSDQNDILKDSYVKLKDLYDLTLSDHRCLVQVKIEDKKKYNGDIGPKVIWDTMSLLDVFEILRYGIQKDYVFQIIIVQRFRVSKFLTEDVINKALEQYHEYKISPYVGHASDRLLECIKEESKKRASYSGYGTGNDSKD